MPNRSSQFKVATAVDNTQSADLSSLTSRIVTLETNATANPDVVALQSRFTSCETVNTNQSNTLTSLSTSMTTAESTNTSQSSNITSLSTRISSLEGVSGYTFFSAYGRYYVDKNGNDSTGNGSADKPYLTIQKAITVAEAAGIQCIIHVGNGTFIENPTITKGIVTLTGNNITGSAHVLENISQTRTYLNGKLTISLTGTSTLQSAQVRVSNMAIDCILDTTAVATAKRTVIVDNAYMYYSSNNYNNLIGTVYNTTQGDFNYIITNSNVNNLASNAVGSLNFYTFDTNVVSYVQLDNCKSTGVVYNGLHLNTLGTVNLDVRYCQFTTYTTTPRGNPFINNHDFYNKSPYMYVIGNHYHGRYSGNLTSNSHAVRTYSTSGSPRIYVVRNMNDQKADTYDTAVVFCSNQANGGVIGFSHQNCSTMSQMVNHRVGAFPLIV